MKKGLSLFVCLVMLFSIFSSGCEFDGIQRIKDDIIINRRNDNRIQGNSDITELSISWWGRDIRHEYMQEGISLFMKENPDIRVTFSYGEWAGYENRYFAKERAGEETDVVLLNVSWIPAISADGKGYYDLEKLTEYLDLSGYTAEELDMGRSNGVLNAIPIALNTQILFFNQDVYESYGLKVPGTWDDLFSAAKVMDGKSYPLYLNDSMLWTACQAYVKQSRRKEFLDKNNDLNFTVDDIKATLDFYQKLVDEKVTPINGKFDITHTGDGLYAGFSGWVSDAERFCSLPKANGNVIKLTTPFVNKGAKVHGWYVKPATLYAISDNTKNPEAAARLLNFLVNDTEMALLQGIEKGFPISDYAASVVNPDEMPTQSEAVGVLEANMPNLDRYNPIEEIKEIRDAFFESGAKVIYGESDSAVEAHVLYERYSEIIELSR